MASDNVTHFTALSVRPQDGQASVFSVSAAGAVAFAGALAINTNKLTVDTSGNTAIAGAFTLNSVAALTGSVTTGTIRSKLLIAPTASATIASIDYHKLVAIGDVTGNTAYGMGDPAKPTTGLMACFGRTALATGTFTDTGADFRVINKLVDTTGVHALQGCYIKAKNYADATLTGALTGLFVETVKDGTVSGLAIGLKLGSDGSVLDADLQFTNGARFVALATAITANSTTTAAPAGSIGITTHNTGVGKLFVSDGSKWQYMAVA